MVTGTVPPRSPIFSAGDRRDVLDQQPRWLRQVQDPGELPLDQHRSSPARGSLADDPAQRRADTA